MSTYRLDTVDEYGHQPTEDSNFNESVYVNGWDPEQKMGLWMRLGNRVNEGHAELSVCIYLPDGRVACPFLRPTIDPNERHSAGAVSYTHLKLPTKRRLSISESAVTLHKKPRRLQ